jgi:2'-phosphotransferase
MNPRLVDLSKSMSWLLRHGADQAGIEMQQDGSISLNEMLKLKQFSRFSRQDILDVVANNDKKRFATQGNDYLKNF